MSTDKINFKLCIFGEGGVGKTSLTHRYLRRVFDDEEPMTIGIDFAVKKIEIEGHLVNLRIWDFGGEDKFKILLPAYAEGADGGIFMYDISRYVTLKKLDDWLLMFQKGSKFDEGPIPIIMVGGKKDLEEKRSVQKEEATHLAYDRNLEGHYECSAKTGDNVEEIFEIITKLMMKKAGLI